MTISISNNTPRPVPASPVVTRELAPTVPEKKPAPAADKVTLSGQAAEAATYARLRDNVAHPDVTSMLEESHRKVQEIINLILPLLKQQGLDIAKVSSGEQKLTVDAATIEEARAAIAEDGEFGVRQVAERILNFAKSAIGEDPAKLASIRAAVEKGFQQASDILGGALPDISQKTHAVIMAQFDRWESEGIPYGAVSLTPKTEEAHPAA